MNANKISYDEDMASIIVIKCLKAFSGQKSIHSLVKEPEKKGEKNCVDGSGKLDYIFGVADLV